MNSRRNSIKKIIDKVLIESEEGQEEQLVQPIDHAAAVGSDPVTDEQEVIDHDSGKVVKISDRKISLSESDFRSLVRNLLHRIS